MTLGNYLLSRFRPKLLVVYTAYSGAAASLSRETEAWREGKEQDKLFLSSVFTSYLDTIVLRCFVVVTQAQH